MRDYEWRRRGTRKVPYLKEFSRKLRDLNLWISGESYFYETEFLFRQ
jgi:hypothetical protein